MMRRPVQYVDISRQNYAYLDSNIKRLSRKVEIKRPVPLKIHDKGPRIRRVHVFAVIAFIGLYILYKYLEKVKWDFTLGEVNEVLLELNHNTTQPDDPRLLEIIRKVFLHRPIENMDYNLSRPDIKDFSRGQTHVVDTILRKNNGFFIECAGLDGESRSTTLFFERERFWKGLLIEPDPTNYVRLYKKRRKCLMMHGCLSEKPHPTTMKVPIFDLTNVTDEQFPNKNIVDVQCFPLYSVLKAINRTHIDFLSLDVEFGQEYHILQTIPFDKVNITMISVECGHEPLGAREVYRFMRSKGYINIKEVLTGDYDLGTRDMIFIHGSVVPELLNRVRTNIKFVVPDPKLKEDDSLMI